MPVMESTSARGTLHKLACVGVERFEIAALAFGEQNVKRERGFARAGDAGDHGEFAARDIYVDVFEIMFAGVVDGY